MQLQGLLWYLAGFMAVFYLFIVLPRQRQEKKRKQMIEGLKVHDRVVTIGGIVAEIKRVKENSFVLKTSEDGELEVLKTAVAYKAE